MGERKVPQWGTCGGGGGREEKRERLTVSKSVNGFVCVGARQVTRWGACVVGGFAFSGHIHIYGTAANLLGDR